MSQASVRSTDHLGGSTAKRFWSAGLRTMSILVRSVEAAQPSGKAGVGEDEPAPRRGQVPARPWLRRGPARAAPYGHGDEGHVVPDRE